MIARTFDPAAVPLTGVNLVEASAGTGKTHAITDLYERLVVEQGCPVEAILVVTYTKAASSELRDRIRARLTSRLRALRPGPSGGSAAGAESAAPRLKTAVARFDLAQIHTIHAFCQRALDETAFEGGQPFASELLVDDGALLEGIVEDFWRRRTARVGPDLAGFLLGKGVGPPALSHWVRPYVARSHLRVVVPSAGPDPEALAARLREALSALGSGWPDAREAVGALLEGAPSLNRASYPATRVRGWLETLDRFCAADAGGEGEVPARILDALGGLMPAALARATKKGHEPPHHPLLELAGEAHQAAAALAAAYAGELARLRAELVEFVRAESVRRNREERTRTFDDLLLGLERALADPGAPGLATALRRRYPFALVDEFQDTDPVQLAILRAIYGPEGPGGAFLVGDPKQAIYGFRGADVFAYLQGRAEASRSYTLTTNRRSVPGLVRAVNGLFGRAPAPFVVEAIRYQAAEPGRGAGGLELEGGRPEPFRVWCLPPSPEGKPWPKPRARSLVAEATAQAVADLLAEGRAGRARIDGRALGGADIAVLVRRNQDARLIQEALAERGVRSVSTGHSDVYASEEARYLEWLLAAVCAPSREPLVRAALASPLFERSGSELDAWASDERCRDAELARFHRWRETWLGHGFGAMYRDVIEQAEVAARVLARRFGERRMTNLLHLGELLQRAEAELHASPEELLAWLAERRGRSERGDEETEQRLESDEALVRVVTVHGAKGLQYPVCFCPFAWDGPARARHDGGLLYHDEGEGGRAVLDLSGTPSRDARAAADREVQSEAVRHLYVALTRAQNLCYVAWGAVNQAERSALGWLLRPPAVGPDGRKRDGGRGVDWGAYDDVWRTLADALPEALALEPLPAVRSDGVAPASAEAGRARLEARRFRGRSEARWGVSSFTSLTSGLPAELPDHDAETLEPPLAEAEGPGVADIPSGIPRGARTGTCLHVVLERVHPLAPVSGQLGMVSAVLEEYGFDPALAPEVGDLVQRVLAAELRPGLRLGAIEPARRVCELEFHFPVAAVRGEALAATARTHGYLRSVAGLPAGARLTGFLKGFVDLVVECEGRYYVVDYKTHWLGGSTSDYRPERLASEVRRGGYELQYLIYTVAVHRYLRLRAPGYDYRRDFGGVLYLFVRGIGRGAPGNGVYFDRPAPLAIDALDAAFAGA